MAAAATDGSEPAFDPVIVEQLFEQYDTDNSGTIDPAELSELCAGLGLAFTAEQSAKILKALDSNGDGQISKGELAVFLASPEAHAQQATGPDGVALRAALLARFFTRAGSALVARISSSGTVESITTDMLRYKTKWSFGEHDPVSAPFRFEARLGTESKMPPPPSGWCGKGMCFDFGVHAGADAAGFVDAFNELLAMAAAVLPEGNRVVASLATVDGEERVRIALDLPMLDMSPALATLFGVSDVEEAAEGSRGVATLTASKDVETITKGAEPILEGLSFMQEGEAQYPKHFIQIVVHMLEIAASDSFPFAAMLQPQQRLQFLWQAQIMKGINHIDIDTHFDSPSDFLALIRTSLNIIPMDAATRMMIDAALATGASFSLAPLEASIIETLTGLLVSQPESPAEALALSACETLASVTELNYGIGPIRLVATIKGLTIPYLREAAVAAHAASAIE